MRIRSAGRPAGRKQDDAPGHWQVVRGDECMQAFADLISAFGNAAFNAAQVAKNDQEYAALMQDYRAAREELEELPTLREVVQCGGYYTTQVNGYYFEIDPNDRYSL